MKTPESFSETLFLILIFLDSKLGGKYYVSQES